MEYTAAVLTCSEMAVSTRLEEGSCGEKRPNESPWMRAAAFPDTAAFQAGLGSIPF